MKTKARLLDAFSIAASSLVPSNASCSWPMASFSRRLGIWCEACNSKTVRALTAGTRNS